MKIIRLNLFRYGAETFWKHSIFFSKNLNIQAKFGQASTGFSRLIDWVMQGCTLTFKRGRTRATICKTEVAWPKMRSHDPNRGHKYVSTMILEKTV